MSLGIKSSAFLRVLVLKTVQGIHDGFLESRWVLDSRWVLGFKMDSCIHDEFWEEVKAMFVQDSEIIAARGQLGQRK